MHYTCDYVYLYWISSLLEIFTKLLNRFGIGNSRRKEAKHMKIFMKLKINIGYIIPMKRRTDWLLRL